MTDQINEIEIDSRVTEQDAKYLRMTPVERELKMAHSGHARPEKRTDQQVIDWFNSLGEIGQLRLRLAQELNAK